MASNYLFDDSYQHEVQDAHITIRYLRQATWQTSTPVQSWEEFVKDKVFQMTTRLVNRGRWSPDASLTLSADPGLSSGLAVEVQITGIELSEVKRKNYRRELGQYLKKMSRALHVPLQMARVADSRPSGQERRRVVEIQNESPRAEFALTAHAAFEDLFGRVAIVPDDVPLRQDDSISGLWEASGSIPFAFLPNQTVPFVCVLGIISIFVPQCSFRPYVIPWSCLPTDRVYLMVATPNFPGSVTGLIAFLHERDVAILLQDISRSAPRMRMNPPRVSLRAPLPTPGFLVAGSSSESPAAAHDADFPTLPTIDDY